MSIKDLETLFNFDKDDLARNRIGFLSEQQRHTIEKSILRRQRNIRIMWMITSLVIVVGLIADFVVHRVITKPTLTYSAIGICIIGTVIYVKVIMNRNAQNMLDDGIVNALQGQISKFKKRKPRSLVHDYSISIGDISFSVSARQYKHLINDDIYTIYYMPRMKILASLEKIYLK